MAIRFHQNDGVSYLQSELLQAVGGVDHAFSTRLGGVSPAPHDTLNLGFYSQDWNDNVTSNWDRFLAAVGARVHGVWYQNQIHGAVVREAPEVDGYAVLGEGDALWTRERQVGLAVITADCVPVLLAAADGSAVAAVHAGWRGLHAGVVEAAIRELSSARGLRPGGLVAASGPHIRECCFEVKDDVAGPFRERFGDPVVHRQPGGRLTISLAVALRQVLVHAGIPEGSIDISDDCTFCDAGRFFSYRRAKGQERGRLGSFIARRGEKAP